MEIELKKVLINHGVLKNEKGTLIDVDKNYKDYKYLIVLDDGRISYFKKEDFKIINQDDKNLENKLKKLLTQSVKHEIIYM